MTTAGLRSFYEKAAKDRLEVVIKNMKDLQIPTQDLEEQQEQQDKQKVGGKGQSSRFTAALEFFSKKEERERRVASYKGALISGYHWGHVVEDAGLLGKLAKFFQNNIYAPVIYNPLTFLGMPKSWRGTIPRTATVE